MDEFEGQQCDEFLSPHFVKGQNRDGTNRSALLSGSGSWGLSGGGGVLMDSAVPQPSGVHPSRSSFRSEQRRTNDFCTDRFINPALNGGPRSPRPTEIYIHVMTPQTAPSRCRYLLPFGFSCCRGHFFYIQASTRQVYQFHIRGGRRCLRGPAIKTFHWVLKLVGCSSGFNALTLYFLF